MRGALMEATLPVAMRTTCVCPSHLLSAAVKRFVMWYLDKLACQYYPLPPFRHSPPFRHPTKKKNFHNLTSHIEIHVLYLCLRS